MCCVVEMAKKERHEINISMTYEMAFPKKAGTTLSIVSCNQKFLRGKAQHQESLEILVQISNVTEHSRLYLEVIEVNHVGAWWRHCYCHHPAICYSTHLGWVIFQAKDKDCIIQSQHRNPTHSTEYFNATTQSVFASTIKDK